jgi:hypothetical protein
LFVYSDGSIGSPASFTFRARDEIASAGSPAFLRLGGRIPVSTPKDRRCCRKMPNSLVLVCLLRVSKSSGVNTSGFHGIGIKNAIPVRLGVDVIVNRFDLQQVAETIVVKDRREALHEDPPPESMD